VLHIIGSVLLIYVVVLIVRALLSWIPLRSGSPFLPVVRALDTVTEPVLRPVRRLVPAARIGGVGLDFSFLLVVVVLEILSSWMLSH